MRARGWHWALSAVSLIALLASVQLASAALIRQPYLQLVTPNSVTIVWRTDDPSGPFNDSRVQYGTNAGNLTQTASGTSAVPLSNSAVKDHFVTITGLASGTKYFYNVGTTNGVEGGGTANHFFVTAPAVGSVSAFNFWALGDSGSGTTRQTAVRDAMLAATGGNPPDFIVHLGDIAYNSGTDAEFTSKHFTVYQNILRQIPLWPSLGCHEAVSVNTELGTGPYYEAHVLPKNGQAGGVPSGTEAYYSFDYGNAHFIVLDSEDSSRAPGSAMLSWLQADLAATNQDWIIAYFHHPPYSKGTHNSDNASDSGGRLVQMRENVLPILEAGGVDLVLTGHSHSYERSYFINGVYGYGTSPNFATPNFATLQANGDILDDGNGNPSGDGAYSKQPDVVQGTVYVVAGHGGQVPGGPGNHPVMVFQDLAANGSVLVEINGSVLTGRSLRSDGVSTDVFSIDKSGSGGPANQRPSVNAGSDQTITLPSTASLNGTVTDDGLPNPPGAVTTTWSKVSGPGTVTFGSASAVDTTATFSAAGTYVLRLTANDGALTNTDDVTITANSSGGGTTARYRINAGGGSYTDSLGQAWSADQGFNTGNARTVTNAIAGTIDDPLFQSERWDGATAPELQYSLAVPNGTYRVNLHFAEIYSGAQKTGARVFDVLIEGSLRFDNLDIFAEVGGFTALTKTVDVSVTDGALNIEFRHVVENPKISAIEVLDLQ